MKRLTVEFKILPSRVKLPHDETDDRNVYSLSNPDYVRDVAERVHRAVYRTDSPADPDDIRALLSSVSDYLHLTTCELGQEHCVRQLRDLWRYRRAVTRESADD